MSSGIKKMVYLAHPVNGDVDQNLARARAWLKFLEACNPEVLFVSQWILGVELWDDSNPVQRELGLLRCLAQVERCDEIWLVGLRVSDGMTREADHACAYGVTVVDLTGPDSEEPPYSWTCVLDMSPGGVYVD